MNKIEAVDPIAHSEDLIVENLDQLKALFPEIITEGPDGAAVNVDVLKMLVGDKNVAEVEEKYGLNWHGKRRARQIALNPTAGTLRPSREESLDWDRTRNLMIEGDNLEVLKILQKSFAGKVKLIYIDPPYNTGNDFVYPDTFQDTIKSYLELTGQLDGGQKMSSNAESSGRFHTDWLNMMYPRLKLARGMLQEDGLIAVHIDEHEVHSLVLMLRELFGEENELGVAIWDKRNPKGDARGIAYQHESIVLFARNAELFFERSPMKRAKRNAQRMLDAAKQSVEATSSIEKATEVYRAWLKEQAALSGGEAMYDRISNDGRVYRLVSMAWPNKKKAPDEYFVPLVHPVTGRKCPVPERGWRNPPDTMKELLRRGLIHFGEDERTQPQRIYFLDENMYENVPSILPYGGSDDALLKELGIPFDQPKPVEFLASVIGWCSSQDDVILDFFAGSGSTAHAVMAQNARDGGNRRYILVQLPEPLSEQSKAQAAAAAFCAKIGKPSNIAEVTKERLRRASSKMRREYPQHEGDLGFRVLRLDSTNFREWNSAPDGFEENLLDSVEHVKAGRTAEDLLQELILKFGLDPCVPIDTRQLGDKSLHVIGGGVLIACLAELISREDAETIANGIVSAYREFAPIGEVTCIFRDSAFSDDVAKVNLSAILEQQGIHYVRSI